MSQVRPSGEPTAVELAFTVEVDDRWRETQIDLTGKRPPKTWYVYAPLEEVETVELRRRLRRLDVGLKRLKVRPVLAQPPSGDLGELAALVEAWLKGAGLLDDALEPPTERFDRERREWIEAHGSPRLKTASSRNYKVNRLYALERAAQEYPGFYADTNASATWSDRADPSTEALGVETVVGQRVSENGHRYRPRIVWLTAPPAELEDRLEESGDVWEQQEAVQIPKYLGRYSLYLPVDPDLARETDDD